MEFEYLEPLVVVAMRHSGPHRPELTATTWEQLILWAAPKRLLGSSGHDVRGVGILWDDPRQFAPDMRRYDVSIPIDPDHSDVVEPPAFLHVLMPGDYMKVTHHGSYSHLPNTYTEALGIAMQVDDLELLAAPIIEVYRNSPSEVDEDDLVTDLYFPVIEL